MEQPIDWLYATDHHNTARYQLGTKGQRPIICIGVNPSTAEPGKLDPTMRNVQKFALRAGFDSFIMMNLYPQRATNPNDMHEVMDERIHQESLKYYQELFRESDPVVWCAWGTLINKRSYLRQALADIYALADSKKVKWVSLGKLSKEGHPHHPLYISDREVFKDFDMEGYLASLEN